MPTYNFRHKETGEEIEKLLRISELDNWKAENPEWKQFLTGAPGFNYNGTKDAISRTPDGFKDHLKRIKKGSGRGNTIRTK